MTFVFNLGATLFPLLVLILLAVKKINIKYNSLYLFLTLFAGMLVGVGGIMLFSLLSKGAAISITFPLVRVISLVLVVILGTVFLSEPLTIKIVTGILFSLIGVFLLMYK